MTEPFIGITCDVFVPRKKPQEYELRLDHRYALAVREAGAYPVLLPIARRWQVVQKYLDGIDGLIIVGGDDVDPRLYGERPKPGTGTIFGPRLAFERQLFLGARRRRLPIFGICYGMQLINVLEGGSLFQDIRRDARSKRNHANKRSPMHRVAIETRSRLGRIIDRRRITVYSDHHQAVARVAPDYWPVAYADDGVIEAIESEDESILAVQWHPECNTRSLATRALFRWFASICAGGQDPACKSSPIKEDFAKARNPPS